MKARFVSNAEETAEKALKSSTITPEGQVIIITSTNIIPTCHDDHHFQADNNYNTVERRQTSAPMESFAPCLKRR